MSSRSSGVRRPSTVRAWLAGVAVAAIVVGCSSSGATQAPASSAALGCALGGTLGRPARRPRRRPRRRLRPLRRAVGRPSAAPSAAPPPPPRPRRASASAAPVGNFQGITLEVLTNDYHKDWEFTIPEITAAFETATGAKINVTYIPSDQRTTKFASIVATKDPTYDLIVATVLEAESYANIMYENLEGKLDPATLPDMTTYTTAGGQGAYALPNLDGVAITYWNTERVAAGRPRSGRRSREVG